MGRIVFTVSAAESSVCAFCERSTDNPPFTPARTVLRYRDFETGQQLSVQLPRTVAICARCMRHVALLAGCPRCRRYGMYPQYAHSPYGSFCVDCGGKLYLMSGDDPVR